MPSPRDPRLHLSLVIGTLQVLGQTVLDFKVSVAQILVTLGFCAGVDVAIELARRHRPVWPASALLTGNSVAFILRASGTRHGDWWSLNGIRWFLLAAAIAMASKHVLRVGGRHRYNPSNLGLVACLLIVGAPEVFPQYLWWGSPGPATGLALAVIAAGAVWILRPVGMWPMVVAFLAPFTVVISLLAESGRCFVAIWHTGPVCGLEYAVDICASPELLVFVCFMMSDPRTAPASWHGRVLYGSATALVAAALVGVQPSEFGIKVAILAALTVVCSVVPVIDRLGRRLDAAVATAPSRTAAPFPPRSPRRRGLPLLAAAVACVLVAASVGTARLPGNQQVIDIDSRAAPGGAAAQ